MAIHFTLHILFLLQCLTNFRVAASISVAKPGCSQLCGNIAIPLPFGVGENCYLNPEFAVTCNTSSFPYKTYLSSINFELLNISLQTTTVRVNGPVISSNCPGSIRYCRHIIVRQPFLLSDSDNKLTALGCDNLALIYRQATVICGCLSICDVTVEEKSCYGINCCQTSIPSYLKFITASLRGINSRDT